MSEKLDSFKSLFISEDIESLCANVFKSSVEGKEVHEGDLNNIIKFAKTDQGKNFLQQLFNNDAISFINGLVYIKDSNGAVIQNIVEKDDISKVFNSLKRVLKDSSTKYISNDDNGRILLEIYYHLSNEYNYIQIQDIPSILNLISISALEPLITIIIAKYIQEDKVGSAKEIENYFDNILGLNLSDNHIFHLLIKGLKCIFPLLPDIGAKLYTNQATLEAILHHIGKFIVNSIYSDKERDIVTSILRLVSVSCIDNKCRTFGTTHYSELLKSGTKMDNTEDDESLKVLSTLCIIKFWNFSNMNAFNKDTGEKSETLDVTLDEMLYIMMNALKSNNQTVLEDAVEGLAYLTLSPKIRHLIRADESAIEVLIEQLTKQTTKANPSYSYGLLLIISNLSNVPEKNNTKEFVKSYAQPQNKDNTEESTNEIKLFNKSLLMDHKILKIASEIKIYKQNHPNYNESRISKLFISLVSMIALNEEKAVRRELAAEGALKILIDFLYLTGSLQNGSSKPKDTSEEALAIRLKALRALSKILISVDPKVAFGKYDIKSSVPFLIELLGPDISKYEHNLTGDNAEYYKDELTNIDKLESLLALTNLASDTKNHELRIFIINKSFESHIDNFLLESDLPHIQKASWELVSNLITEPLMLAKFFNVEVKENRKRLMILIKLIESEQSDLQLVIAGLLANALNGYDMICQVIMNDEEIWKHLLNSVGRVFLIQDDDTELMKRLLFAIGGLIYNSSHNDESIHKIKSNEILQKGIFDLKESNKDAEIQETINEIKDLI